MIANPSSTQPTGGRSLRRFRNVVLGVVIAFALIVVTALAYQAISESSDLRHFTPPGRLVEVDGRQMHLYCTGEGSPTVLLESGLAAPSLQWGLVQAQLQNLTRVCSYDRSGVGWSEPGPQPRTSRQMAEELHRLLAQAKVSGPYLLVGHSLGGLNVRLFAHLYSKEVIGLVLVASGSENDISRMPPEYSQIEQANMQTNRLLSLLSRFGIVRLARNSQVMSSLRELFALFPEDLQEELIALTVFRPSYWATAYQELAALDESRLQVAASGSLTDLPLVVISGSPDLSRLPPSFPVEEIRLTAKALQHELAGLSSNSTHITCDTCDHYIPMTKPDLVVGAVETLLGQIQPP